ncbi:MAG TPA: hypothetical protein VKA60_14470 [Blastocatellia bacterium]|nr:hypothetical protein [Blastocatellia bacterium]
MTRLLTVWTLMALFALGPIAPAQIKVELPVPKRKQNISTDSRIEVRHLEHAMNTLRQALKESNPPDVEFARGTLVMAKQSLAEVKRLYPDYSTAKYEREIAEYDRMMNDDDAAGDSLDEVKAFIRKTAYASEQLIPQTYWKGIYTQTKGDAERYFEKCKALNYGETIKQVKDALAKHPGLRTDGDISDHVEQLLTKFPKEYDEFVRGFLIGEINAAIEKAYVEKKKGSGAIGAATEAANIALTLANGVLLAFPDHPQALRIRKDAEAIVGAVERDLGGKVYAGAFHKQNAGKVVYSRKPLVAGQEDAAAVAKAFSLADAVYAMAYFKGTIAEMADGAHAGETEMQMTVFLDGNEMTSFNYPMTRPMEQWTFMPIEVLPALETAKECEGSSRYARLLAECSPRNHTLGFRVSAIFMSYRHDLAEGEFEIDCSSGQEKMAERAVAYHKIALKNVFMPKPAKVEPALERAMVEATRGMLTDQGKPGVPVRAVITEREWTLYRHPISGIITRRAINGAVAVKRDDGTCYFYGMTFSEQNNGGWGRLHWSSTDNGTEMDCGNVTK